MSDHVAQQLGHDRVSDALDRQRNRIAELEGAIAEVLTAFNADITERNLDEWGERLNAAFDELRRVAGS